MGEFLRAPREVGHSGNVTDLFSSVRGDQREYIDGLLVVSVIFSFLFLIWAFILIVLKCKGKEVGCASGRAFVDFRLDESSSETDLGKTQDDIASTSDSSNASHSVSSSKPLFSDYGGTVLENSNSYYSDDNNHSGRNVWGRITGQQNKSKGKNDGVKINRCERNTRLVFILFASGALICAPFTLFLTFGPLNEVATQSTDNLISVRGTVTSYYRTKTQNI